MPASPDLAALSPLVEMLIEAREHAERDRILLDAPSYLGIATAVALWRPGRSEQAGRPAWRQILARGPEDALPGRDLVEGVAEGSLDGELPDGKRVLLAGSGTTRCALALGGILGSEEQTDLLESLLIASAAVEEASGASRRASNDLDRLAPALPAASRPQSHPDESARLRHDVRNHLASIRSTQELLIRYDQKLTPEERDHFRSVLEREVRRAGSLLVQAVRADEGEGKADGGMCLHPVAVVRDLVGAERAACAAAGVGLELREEAGAEDAACYLDEVALARLLRNLIVNARQALRGCRDALVRVSVGPDRASDELRIQVDDNGPGIPVQELPRVWDAGFTLGSHGGSGIGLFVVRELAEAAGGSVEVRNLHPSGASFVVRLPRVPTRSR